VALEKRGGVGGDETQKQNMGRRLRGKQFPLVPSSQCSAAATFMSSRRKGRSAQTDECFGKWQLRYRQHVDFPNE
jgi:hypothetical protein